MLPLNYVAKFLISLVALITISYLLFSILSIELPFFVSNEKRIKQKALIIEKEPDRNLIEDLCENCEKFGRKVMRNILCYVIKSKKEIDYRYLGISTCKNYCDEVTNISYIAYDLKEGPILAC